MESSVNNGTGAPPKDIWVEHVLLPSLFLGACFLIGIPGNSLVIWTIVSRIRQRSLTIVLILNLAVADFIVLFTLPLWIHSLADGWVYGLFACRFLTYIIHCTIYSSVFFLTLMSVQRFCAVVFPLTSRKWQNKKVIYGLVLAIWALALGFSSPVFVFRVTVETNGTVRCDSWLYASDRQKIEDLLVQLFFSFVIPFLILTVCYALVLKRLRRLLLKGKDKPGKLIASMIIAFFVCWFPYHLVNALSISAISLSSSHPEKSRTLEKAAKSGENISGALVFLSSCLNPILYAFAARSFRGGLRGTNFEKLFGQLNEDTVEETAKGSKITYSNTHVSLENI